MTNILVIDDRLYVRKSVVTALKDRYETAVIDREDLTDRMIEELQPSIVLLNRFSKGFDVINLFLKIKNHYPDMPALLYVANNPDGLKGLRQTISMVLDNDRLKTGNQFAH